MLSGTWSNRVGTDHHATTATFDSVVLLWGGVSFTADVTGHDISKKFNFCPVSPQNTIINYLSWSVWSLICFSRRHFFDDVKNEGVTDKGKNRRKLSLSK